MQRSELLATVERLCDVELDLLERDELAAMVAASARVRGWLDAVDLRCSRRGRNLAEAGHAEPSSSMLARNGNRSNRDASQIDRRDKVAEAMPSLEDGLSEGTVSAGHLDAIANATRNASPEVRAAFAAHEDDLAAFAATDTVEVFTRRCRALVAELTAELTGDDASELDRQRADSRIRSWVDAETGMHHTHAALDPLRHEILWNAINRSLRRRQRRDGNARTPWNQMQVDALIDAVKGDAAPTRSAPGPSAPRASSPGPSAPGGSSPGPSAPGGSSPSRPAPGGSSPGRPARGGSSPGGASPPTAPEAAPCDAAPNPASTPPADSAADTSSPNAAAPPNPAADIARDLVDAIDRSIRTARGCGAGEPHADWIDDDDNPRNATGDGGRDEDVEAEEERDEHDDEEDDEQDREQVDGSDAIEAEMRRIEQRLPEVSVLVDLDVLVDGLHAHGICETEDGIALPVSTVRRLCCDAEVIPIVLGGDGVALDVGRTARTVNRAQRRALRAMHRTCAHPDCDVPFSHTKIHHVRWWVRDRGPTDIDNLLPLCERHHHLVHEGRWGLTMTPDRIATWTRPDGVVAHHGSTIDRSAEPPPTPPPTTAAPPGR